MQVEVNHNVPIWFYAVVVFGVSFAGACVLGVLWAVISAVVDVITRKGQTDAE